MRSPPSDAGAASESNGIGATSSYGSIKISAARRLPRTRKRSQSISIQPRCKGEDAIADRDQADAHGGGDVEGLGDVIGGDHGDLHGRIFQVLPCMTPPKPSMAMTSRMP